MDESLLIIIHNAIKKALSANIATKVRAVSGGKLPPTGPNTTTRYGPKPKPLAQCSSSVPVQ